MLNKLRKQIKQDINHDLLAGQIDTESAANKVMAAFNAGIIFEKEMYVCLSKIQRDVINNLLIDENFPDIELDDKYNQIPASYAQDCKRAYDWYLIKIAAQNSPGVYQFSLNDIINPTICESVLETIQYKEVQNA
jgi:hypothetical protein